MIPPDRTNTLRKNPLNPLEDATLEELFVDVDDSRLAFDQFREDFAGSQWLADGAIVVATGPEQTGKTALIYRCAYWLRSQVESAGVHRVYVLDCSDIGVREDMAIADRMKKLVAHLGRMLHRTGVLTGDDLLSIDDPGVFFHDLADSIESTAVIVVILPNSADLSKEIVDYAQMVRKRVMLLVETSYSEEVARVRPQLEKKRATVSVLKLGELKDTDGDLFYSSRRAMHPLDAAIPPPAPGALYQIVKNARAVGELQKLLSGMYDDILRQPTAVTTVTYEYFTDYYYRTRGER